MKEFLELVKERNFNALFLDPSNNLIIQMFRYLFVGGGAFLVDTGSLCLLALFINKYIATAIGFILGLIVNFALSKAFVFKKEKLNFTLSKEFVFKKGKVKAASVIEFIVYGVIGLIGLGLTELLIYFFTEIIPFSLLLAKIIAAAIVLIWNFAARKVTLYRKSSTI